MGFNSTRDQQALIDVDESSFFSACPGAGKTQTIVERFIQRKAHRDPRKGIALITFTRASAEEAKRRCASSPERMLAPNFVGTIDGFLNLFFARPVYGARYGQQLTIRETWSDFGELGVITFWNKDRGRSIPSKISLDNFSISNVRASLNINSIKRGPKFTNAQKLSSSERLDLEKRAKSQRDRLLGKGLASQQCARDIARYALAGNKFGLTDLIASRFEEIIVDEVQDCNEFDVQLLTALKNAGTRVILVGDLDQSIFEFRGSDHDALSKLIESGLKRPQRLNGNFRSSPEICKAVGTLRPNYDIDKSVGEAQTCNYPIEVVSFDKIEEVSGSVERLLKIKYLDSFPSVCDPVVLSSEWINAAKAAGGGLPKQDKRDLKTFKLALACIDLCQDSNTPSQRRKALEMLGSVVQDAYPNIDSKKGSSMVSHMTLDEFAYFVGATPGDFREKCLRLAMAVGDPRDKDLQELKKVVKSSFEQIFFQPKKGVQFFPATDKWREFANESALPRYRFSSIHGYKGLEEESIVVVIPEKDQGVVPGVEDWELERESENRRLLYVAASRAKRLLIFAVHRKHVALVENSLKRHDVVIQSTTLSLEEPSFAVD